MCNQPNSPICDKWRELGGFKGPGQTLQGPFLVLNGDATAQIFERAVIVYTRDHHAFAIPQETFDLWLAMSSDPAPLDEPFGDFQQYMGCPTADQVTVAADGTAAHFERGMIVCYTQDFVRRQVTVHGAMYLHYSEIEDISSPLGLPLSSAIEVVHLSGHRAADVQRFQQGSIWRPTAPARGPVALWGLIGRRYEQLSPDQRAVLGFPLSRAGLVEPPGGGVAMPDNACVKFDGGAVYSHFQLGASIVRSALVEPYERTYGGPSGQLGYPLADTQRTPTSGGLYNDFQGGVLVWHDPQDPAAPFGGGAVAVTQLEADLKSFRILDGDGLLNEELEIFVDATIGHDGGTSEARLPPTKTYDNDEDVDVTILLSSRVRGAFVATLHFEGHDEDTFVDDDAGTVDIVANVDNLWLVKAGLQPYRDRQFEVTCSLHEPSRPVDHNRWDRAEHFWRFRNFNTARLSGRQYDATFTDIHKDLALEEKIFNKILDPLDAAWEVVFYHAIYKGIAKDGNCFAMCAESVYAEVGRSPFPQPIHQHPRALPGLVDQLNIKMGYQAGNDLVAYFIGEFLLGNTHDPVGAFAKSRSKWNDGDWPLIAVTPGTLQIAGHVLRPYSWFERPGGGDSGNQLVISVANPNNPAAPTDDPDDQAKVRDNSAEECEIRIDPAENEYSIRVGSPADEPVWTGGDDVFKGGRMYTIPYSQFASHPRTPTYEVLVAIAIGTLILLGNAGESSQISAASGATFYEPDLGGPPTHWDHIRQDEGGIGNLVRLPLFAGDGPQPEMYFLKGTEPSLRYELSARSAADEADPYLWAMRGPNISATVAFDPVPGKVDSVTAGGIASRDPTVSVKPAPDGPDRNVTLRLAGFRGAARTDVHWFGIDELVLAPGHEFGMGMNDACRELRLENKGGTGVSCRVSTRDGAARQVAVAAGQAVWIRPDWNDLQRPWRIEADTNSLRRFMERRALSPDDGVRKHFPGKSSLLEILASS